MKILMLTEYFYPFNHGGTEQSVARLGEALITKKKYSVIILTPNYGTKASEVWRGITISRFSFPHFIRSHHPKNLTPLWFANPLWYFFTFIFLANSLFHYKPDLVHVQSKSFLIPAILAKFIFHQKVIVTIRDYQILCPYGLCLNKRRDFKKCSFQYFIRHEQREYIKQYFPNSFFLKKVILQMTGIYHWCIAWILRSTVRLVDSITCISKKQQKIYAKNSINISNVIYNLMDRPKKLRTAKKYDVLFIGRLTPGKGAHLFSQAVVVMQNTGIPISAAIIGEGFLKANMDKKKIALLGQQSYEKTLSLMHRAKMVVVPSVWEEPFGRVALEALVCGTPVVATNVGGLPEVVEHGINGIIVEPSTSALVDGIREMFSKNQWFKRNIQKQQSLLNKKFYVEPLHNYEKIYQSI